MEYINIPGNPSKLVIGRTYYQVGIRVMTEFPVNHFVAKWNNTRYEAKKITPQTAGPLRRRQRYKGVAPPMQLDTLLVPQKEGTMRHYKTSFKKYANTLKKYHINSSIKPY